MNNTYPPFDNERVRQALAMAIDRQRIVDNFYPPASSVATQFMPPSIFGYSEGQTWYDYNPEEAKKILEEEGVLPGFKTTITYRDVVRGYLPNPGIVAQDIQAQLADIGVEAEHQRHGIRRLPGCRRCRRNRRLAHAGLGRRLSGRHQLP